MGEVLKNEVPDVSVQTRQIKKGNMTLQPELEALPKYHPIDTCAPKYVDFSPIPDEAVNISKSSSTLAACEATKKVLFFKHVSDFLLN